MSSGISSSLEDGDHTFAMRQEFQPAEMADRIDCALWIYFSEPPVWRLTVLSQGSPLSRPREPGTFLLWALVTVLGQTQVTAPWKTVPVQFPGLQKAQPAFDTEILLLPSKTQVTRQDPAFPLAASMTSMLLWMWKCSCELASSWELASSSAWGCKQIPAHSTPAKRHQGSKEGRASRRSFSCSSVPSADVQNQNTSSAVVWGRYKSAANPENSSNSCLI